MSESPYYQEDDDDQQGTGTGGQGSQVAFRDFTGSGTQTRDDLLSFEEKRHLLAVHQNLNEAKIKQQKEKRQQYRDLKNGKTTLQSFREGLAQAGRKALYKVFPALADKAQFSGSTDSKVNPDPNLQIADTNQDKRNELTYQPELTPKPEITPKFNPRPPGF